MNAAQNLKNEFDKLTEEYIQAKNKVDAWWSINPNDRNFDQGQSLWDNFKKVEKKREECMEKLGLGCSNNF